MHIQSSHHKTLCFHPSCSSSIPFYISNSFTPIVFPLLKLHCFLGVKESTSVSCFLPSEAGIKWFRHQKEDNIWRNGNLFMLKLQPLKRTESCSKENTQEDETWNKKHSSSSPSLNPLAWYSHWRGSFSRMKEGDQSRQHTEFLCQDVQHRRNVHIFLLQKHLLGA